MDLLLEMNNSPQLPVEKRIDIDQHDDDDIEEVVPGRPRSLAHLERTVPHKPYSEIPGFSEDASTTDPDALPASILTADDVDDYLHELDTRLERDNKPTLAPSARPGGKPALATNFALRNPTSVFNWLKKHAPKTFLQDLEKDKDKRGGDHENGDRENGGKRKSTAARGKRQSGVSRKGKEKAGSSAETMEWDDDAGYDVQATKGKRKRGEDSGYRPKGGSSRPSKKRKSGGAESKGRKSMGD